MIDGVSHYLFFLSFFSFCYVLWSIVMCSCWIYSCFRILCIQRGEMDSILFFCKFMWMS